MKQFGTLTFILVVFSSLSTFLLFDQWGLFAFSGALLLLPSLYFTFPSQPGSNVRSTLLLGACLSSCLYHLSYLNLLLTVGTLSYLSIQRRCVGVPGDYRVVLSLVVLPGIVFCLRTWFGLARHHIPNFVVLPLLFARVAALPLAVAAVFLLLFIASNPVIEHLFGSVAAQLSKILETVWAAIGIRSLLQSLLTASFIWHFCSGEVQHKSFGLVRLFERAETTPTKHWRSLEKTRFLLLLLVPLFAFHLSVDFYVLATRACHQIKFRAQICGF